MSISPEIVTLLGEIVGGRQVRTDQMTLDATSHDTWPMTTKWQALGQHPYRADVLVRATAVAQIPAILKLANAQHIPVTVRALASSVTGQPIPTQGGIVLDVTQLPQFLDFDETNMMVTCSANYLGSDVEDELNLSGYTLGHSPQSLTRSSVGGWVSTLATGQFSSLYGGIEDLVVAYQVILASGEIINLDAKPRAAMGPDLRQLFIGSEGTLGVITAVTLKVFPLPEREILGSYALPSVSAGLAFMKAQASAGFRPFLLRCYNEAEASHAMVDPNFKSPALFLGSRGVKELAETEFRLLEKMVQDFGGTPLGSDAAAAWMERRYDFSSVENKVATPGGIAETIEVAHLWSGIEELYQVLNAKLTPLADEVLAHWSHVYTQGTSMYLILFAQVADDAAAVARLDEIWATTMDVCLELGAELSHHHGGGLIRSPYSKRSLGSAHLVLEKVKAALDPNGILNPGKLGL